MILDVVPSDLPLCPNIESPLHQLHVRLQDAAYNSNPITEDLDFHTEELNTMYDAIAYKQFNGRMHLYKDSVTVTTQQITVTAYYFRCNICFLILPATEKSWT